jgi:hypothetical protein
MYKVQSDSVIDVASEVLAMVDFIRTRWTNIPEDLAGFFSAIQEEAFRAADKWFDESDIMRYLIARTEAREALLTQVLSSDDEKRVGLLYDQGCHYLMLLTRAATRVGRDALSDFDFEEVAREVYDRIKARYPEIIEAQPKGFGKKSISMHKYAETLQLKEQAAFQGANVSKGGPVCFATRTSTPHVAYDQYEQGREAPFVLTYAALGHFLAVKKHDNTREMLKALAAFNLRDTEPALVFDLEIGHRPASHRLVNALARECAVEKDARERYFRALERQQP